MVVLEAATALFAVSSGLTLAALLHGLHRLRREVHLAVQNGAQPQSNCVRSDAKVAVTAADAP